MHLPSHAEVVTWAFAYIGGKLPGAVAELPNSLTEQQADAWEREHNARLERDRPVAMEPSTRARGRERR
jgi:hypothetical protein